MHFKKIGATLCLLTLSSINTALADGYLGLSYGTTSPDESGFEDDNGFKITGGGKLNDNFAVEVSYTDLGAFEMDRALVREIEYFVGYDLDGVDIGESFKISSIKLDKEVTPTIQGRDFVIATLAAPTVMKEPEKPAEAETAEGEEGAEGEAAAAAADGDKPAADGAKGDKKEGEDKKPAEKKPAEEKK